MLDLLVAGIGVIIAGWALSVAIDAKSVADQALTATREQLDLARAEHQEFMRQLTREGARRGEDVGRQ